ncbi:MAG: sensor histidine kinase [Mobilicoccus sp.]|nr:sensor histidine kinase [Mobilicoccus sp.]
MPFRRSDASLARQILALQAVVVVLMVGLGLVFATVDERGRARDRATEQALLVAQSVADSPAVLTDLRTEDPSASLQPFAERVRADTGVDFVVVMTPTGTRYTHPRPDRIGGQFVGGLGDAPRGRVHTEEFVGTLGPSMRAVVPVLDRDSGEVVALVAVGITLEEIEAEVWRTITPMMLAGLMVLALGAIGTALVGRRLGRATHGLSARELTDMYEYHQAVLHAVREGLLLLDAQHRVRLVNAEAQRLLDLPPEPESRAVGDLGLPPPLVAAIRAGRAESDDLYVIGGHALVVSAAPARRGNRLVGSVVTVRDRTELQAVSGELDVVRQLSAALRSQNHESANRLHTVVSLVELGRTQEAIDFATEELAVAQMLADTVVASVDEPVLSALLLGKTAVAFERGVNLIVDGQVTDDRSAVDPRALVTVTGNLIDNALDALADAEQGRVEVDVDWDADRFVIAVGDDGPGIDPSDTQRVLQRGWSTKAGPAGSRGIGLSLVAQIASAAGGVIDVGRSHLGGALITVTLPASPGGVGTHDERTDAPTMSGATWTSGSIRWPDPGGAS